MAVSSTAVRLNVDFRFHSALQHTPTPKDQADRERDGVDAKVEGRGDQRVNSNNLFLAQLFFGLGDRLAQLSEILGAAACIELVNWKNKNTFSLCCEAFLLVRVLSLEHFCDSSFG